jgi:hypothetical protein
MEEQLELIGLKNKQGCNFSRTPMADTWMVNIRITASEKFPFVHCDECPRQVCYRYRYGKSIWAFSEHN